MSEVAQATSAWPLALNTTRTAIDHCNASQTPVAMPQPTRSPASRIDRGSGLRLSQPNASAPWRFSMKPEDVRVMSQFMGGGFGSGLRPQFEVVLAVLAALALKRSVRVVLTRPQMYGL